MELRQLAHFLAVAETSHFTRAASRVHLTQSSLSSSIRSLERELGSDLFVRSTRRVELTDAGRALLPAARRTVAAAEDGLTPSRESVDCAADTSRSESSKRRPSVPSTYPHCWLAITADIQRSPSGCTTPAWHHCTPHRRWRLELAIVDLPLGPRANRVTARRIGTESLLLGVRSRSARQSQPRAIDRPRRLRLR